MFQAGVGEERGAGYGFGLLTLQGGIMLEGVHWLTLCSSSRGLRLPNPLSGGSQPPVIPAPGDLEPSPGLCRYTHTCDTHAYTRLCCQCSSTVEYISDSPGSLSDCPAPSSFLHASLSCPLALLVLHTHSSFLEKAFTSPHDTSCTSNL